MPKNGYAIKGYKKNRPRKIPQKIKNADYNLQKVFEQTKIYNDSKRNIHQKNFESPTNEKECHVSKVKEKNKSIPNPNQKNFKVNVNDHKIQKQMITQIN